ncbi:ABC transporter substrate-binding protein [Candidatus Omnitrophota bacterium]
MLRRMGVFILILLCFSGCAPQQSADNDTIVIWHWMTDRQAVLEELAAQYEAATGVGVDFQLFSPPGAYSSKIIASAQANNLPDIFGILGEKRDTASFVKAGHILDLTPYLEENDSQWKNSLFSSTLKVTSFDPRNRFGIGPGSYAVPIDLMDIQMIYNKRLLTEAGIADYPRTWPEFIADLKILKGKGVKGFVSGWAATWLIDCLASNYAFNIMGEDKVFRTIKGEVPYTDPDWLKVFSLFEELRDSGGLASGVVTMDNKYAEQLFANEKAAFAFNGSWCVNVYNGMNPDLEYGVILPPQVSDQHPVKIWGGAGASLYVNANSPLKEEAVKFLQWLTAKDQQVYLVNKTRNLPANREALAEIPQILAEFADDAQSITHPNMWPYQEYPKVIETFTKGLQSIIIGEISVQDLASRIQNVKEKELAKEAR